MRKLPIWDQLAHTPILEVIAVPHSHRRLSSARCRLAHLLVTNTPDHGLRLHLFHDDENRLYVVKLPSPKAVTQPVALGRGKRECSDRESVRG